jgi:hypothetical protein
MNLSCITYTNCSIFPTTEFSLVKDNIFVFPAINFNISSFYSIIQGDPLAGLGVGLCNEPVRVRPARKTGGGLRGPPGRQDGPQLCGPWPGQHGHFSRRPGSLQGKNCL